MPTIRTEGRFSDAVKSMPWLAVNNDYLFGSILSDVGDPFAVWTENQRCLTDPVVSWPRPPAHYDSPFRACLGGIGYLLGVRTEGQQTQCDPVVNSFGLTIDHDTLLVSFPNSVGDAPPVARNDHVECGS